MFSLRPQPPSLAGRGRGLEIEFSHQRPVFQPCLHNGASIKSKQAKKKRGSGSFQVGEQAEIQGQW